MSRDPGRTASGQPRGLRDVGRRDAVARNPGAYSLRQRPRVYRQGTADVAGDARGPNAVHHPWQSVGERLLRELQRQAAGRVLERRTFLFAEGSADRHRTVAGAGPHPSGPLPPSLPPPPRASPPPPPHPHPKPPPPPSPLHYPPPPPHTHLLTPHPSP